MCNMERGWGRRDVVEETKDTQTTRKGKCVEKEDVGVLQVEEKMDRGMILGGS